MRQLWGGGKAGEVHTWFWWGNQKNDRIGSLKRAWEDSIQMEFKKKGPWERR
jgi:hypothetical protein